MIYAKYTVVLKTLMEDPEIKPLLDKAMSSYKMYKPEHPELYGYIPTREELNQKILNHYKYNEIGFETIGRFLDELEIALNEIMPLYNQMYKSVDIMNGLDDIFGNLDVKESFEQSTEGSASGTAGSENTTNTTSEANSESQTTSSAENHSKNVESSTPQGDILSINNKGIDSVTHADQINWNHTNSEDTANNTGKDTTSAESTQTGSEHSSSERSETITHTLTRKGNQGVNTYAHDMLEFRQLFVNIEQRIINDIRIRELFMLVY